MKIEIKDRFDNRILLCGEYESIKDCLEKNRNADLWKAYLGCANLGGADLRDANLGGADLRGADLRCANLGCANLGGADLRDANLGGANLWGANLWDANLGGANLWGANLWDANLRGANLWGANLRGAYLRGADLGGANLRDAKSYFQSREIFIQLIRNNLIKFSKHQQEIASRIFALEFCWETIKKEYGKEIGKIFDILKELGWEEYANEWERRKK